MLQERQLSIFCVSEQNAFFLPAAPALPLLWTRLAELASFHQPVVRDPNLLEKTLYDHWLLPTGFQ